MSDSRGLVFWTADLPVNLNTATYIRGRFVFSCHAGRGRMPRHSVLGLKSSILSKHGRPFGHASSKHSVALLTELDAPVHTIQTLLCFLVSWCRNWLRAFQNPASIPRMFDVFVLSLDYGYLALSTDVVLLRFVRILRVVRLVRIVKLSKLNTMIEESAASAGRQWVTLVVAITKTAITMLMVAHFLTCAWFYIGLHLGPELPSLSWVEIAQIAERPDAWHDVLDSCFSFPEFPVPPDA